MPRIARMIIAEQKTGYHVVFRTALEGFPLEDVEKNFLMDLIKRLGKMYFSQILGFCIMGDHIHLLVRMIPEHHFTDDDIRVRYKAYYGDRELFDAQITVFRSKWANLSEFMREIKQIFSRFYNKRHNRRGFFWRERFKSVIVEDGEALLSCLAYIDLNPVRAGLVRTPEDYPWSSLGYHHRMTNEDPFLCLDVGLTEFEELNAKERLRRYRRYVHEAAGINRSVKPASDPPDRQPTGRKADNSFEEFRRQRFTQRSRYFTDSGIIGSKDFVAANYQRFKDLFTCRHDKIPKPIKGLNGVYSLKRLSEP